MRINLKEIPKDGKDFIVDSKTGELNEILEDILKGRAFMAEFQISPLETGQYELKGRIRSDVPENCSRCGDDMVYPIDKQFKEMLLPALEQPKDAKYTKPNHYSEFISEGEDSNWSVSEYRGHHFDLGEYVHELVAIAVPFNPAPPCDRSGRCTLCHVDTTAQSFGYEDQVDLEPKVSPFEVLKKLK